MRFAIKAIAYYYGIFSAWSALAPNPKVNNAETPASAWRLRK